MKKLTKSCCTIAKVVRDEYHVLEPNVKPNAFLLNLFPVSASCMYIFLNRRDEGEVLNSMSSRQELLHTIYCSRCCFSLLHKV